MTVAFGDVRHSIDHMARSFSYRIHSARVLALCAQR